MTAIPPISGKDVADMDTSWPVPHAWAVDQMPCPAYCCSITGAIIHCNPAAVRIWGGHPTPGALWDGFAVLHDLEGHAVAGDASPCATAATGKVSAPIELFANANDGQWRRIVIHAKPIVGTKGTIVGVLCCMTDISDKHRLQQRVRHMASAREGFIGMLAHELRNPLAPIMSVAGYLQRADVDQAVSKMAGVVERQTKQLARFITDLLDASRVDLEGKLPVETRICTEDEVLTLALDAVEPDVRARRQRLIVEVTDAGGGALCCDPQRVAQALGNVLSNASAFTPDGEAFSLRVFVDGDILFLEVVDCGAGIAPEDLAHVFNPFERCAVAPGRAPVGAGLGLTIAKGVCEAHGGSIDVRSAGLGKGTTVSLALPVADRDASGDIGKH